MQILLKQAFIILTYIFSNVDIKLWEIFKWFSFLKILKDKILEIILNCQLQKMKIFVLFLVNSLKALCVESKPNAEECKNWAAYMPGHYWTFSPEKDCYLKKKSELIWIIFNKLTLRRRSDLIKIFTDVFARA